MGLGVALRNLFQSIFGKKKTEKNGSQITREIRMRAKELGISPEDYLKITKENGSVWGTGYSDLETGPYVDFEETDYDTINKIRANLQEKYERLGIPMDDVTTSGNKPTFGLISRSRPVEEAQETADKQNAAAENFFQDVSRETEQNIFMANQGVKQAEQTAEQNNNNAKVELTKSQSTVKDNNAEAEKQQQDVAQQAQQNNERSQQKVEESQQQADTNNQQAVQNTQNAQNNSNTAAQAVTSSQERLNTANQKLQQAQATADASGNQTPEASAEVQKAKEERDAAKTEVEKAKTDEEKAKQELDSAKKQEEGTKQKGQAQVDEAAQHAESTKTDGEQQVEQAKEKTEEVKQQGDKRLAEAQTNVDKTQKTGEQQVKSQQDNADQVSKTGQKSVQEAQTRVDETKREGVKDVKAAEQDTTKQVDKAQTQAAQQLQAAKPDNETTEALKKAIEARALEEARLGRTNKLQGAESILPDGTINNKVSQQGNVGNCWAHSGVTSMASTPGGKAFLEQNIYRDKERGITAVRLKEAGNNGLGYNKTGVYTFTDDEIIRGAATFGSGDGDNTAYMLAAEKYLQEKGEYGSHKAASDGNTDVRFYEIVSGTKSTQVRNSDNIARGISWGMPSNGNMYNFQTLYNGIRSGNTSGTLIFNTNSGSIHALPIVGVAQNGNLLIQDPYNDGRPHFSLGQDTAQLKRVGSVNGATTYELTKELYEKYAKGCGTYRWA